MWGLTMLRKLDGIETAVEFPRHPRRQLRPRSSHTEKGRPQWDGPSNLNQ